MSDIFVILRPYKRDVIIDVRRSCTRQRLIIVHLQGRNSSDIWEQP